MAIPRRGLQDIRTLTGRVRQATIPHEAYLRISHLEMERARKSQENEKARQLMADIQARLQEIEAEKEALLQAMVAREAHPAAEGCGWGPGNGGFKIKY